MEQRFKSIFYAMSHRHRHFFFLRQPNDTMFFDYLLEKIEFKRIESEAIKVMILKRTLKTVELVCLLAKIVFFNVFCDKKILNLNICAKLRSYSHHLHNKNVV